MQRAHRQAREWEQIKGFYRWQGADVRPGKEWMPTGGIGWPSQIDPINKAVLENQKHLVSLQKENKEIKKILKNIEKKLEILSDKIQEFEVVFDAAEILEEEMDRRDEYNTEWNPYDDEDFQVEDYEDYDDDEDDDVIRGY